MDSLIMNMISSQLDNTLVKQISSQIGANEQSTQQAIGTAVPLLLNALDRNTNSQTGAQSLATTLEQNHDGQILNNVAEALLKRSTTQDGAAILSHILGPKQQNVEKGISKSSGLDLASASELLQMLAPLVMGALGQLQNQQKMDASSISKLLTQERQATESSLSGLSRLLDMDSDGDVTDDMLNLGSNLLGSFLGGSKK